MRFVSILTAVVFVAVLYGLVVERDRLRGFARDIAPAQNAPTAPPKPVRDGAAVVMAMATSAHEIDDAVLRRGQTRALRGVQVSRKSRGAGCPTRSPAPRGRGTHPRGRSRPASGTGPAGRGADQPDRRRKAACQRVLVTHGAGSGARGRLRYACPGCLSRRGGLQPRPGAAGGLCDPGVVPAELPVADGDGHNHVQHRDDRADPRGGHAGGRRHRDDRIRRQANFAGQRPDTPLCRDGSAACRTPGARPCAAPCRTGGCARRQWRRPGRACSWRLPPRPR